MAPADHHNTFGQFNPLVHGFTGVNSVSLAGFPLDIDGRVIKAAHQSLGTQFSFNLDYNSGRHLGVGMFLLLYQLGRHELLFRLYSIHY